MPCKLEPCTLLLAGMPITYWTVNAKHINFLAPLSPFTPIYASKTIPGMPYSYPEHLEVIFTSRVISEHAYRL